MTSVPMKVDFIDWLGTDISVVNAARVSFAKESAFENGILGDRDRSLITFLAKHNHFTPFCHCMATFRIKAPIFVARQLVKHQVGFSGWNEVSRRYVDESPEYWLPDSIRARPNGAIKQGSGGDHELSDVMLGAIDGITNAAISFYSKLIGDGVAPEQARMVLPLNCMTEWFWTGSLAAWARMCKLRLDAHAQAETREVAVMIGGHMQDAFPVSWAALMGVKGDDISA